MVGFGKTPSPTHRVACGGVLDVVRGAVPRADVSNPAALDMNTLVVQMQAGDGAVDREHQFAPFGASIANRPDSPVLGANKEVESAFLDEGDCTNTA